MQGTSPIKSALICILQILPDDCTWDDVMYHIDVRLKIEAGLQDIEAGRTYTHEEVFAEFGRLEE